MTGLSLRGLWLKARVTVYIGIVAILLLSRVGGCSFPRLGFPRTGAAGPAQALLISGGDLAPALIARLVSNYRRDYPKLAVEVRPGGTAQGLEDLANRRADVAFLSRPPAAAEQQLIRNAGQDTLLWFPMALGSLVLLRGAECPVRRLSPEVCRAWFDSSSTPPGRLYAPDPNTGAWEGLAARLGVALPAGASAPPGVTFLADQAAVLAAIQQDPSALGLVSSFGFPEGSTPFGVDTVALQAAGSDTPASPTDDAVAYGDYPLYHYLYVACRPHDSIRGTMFVTHLTGDRGQRQVERAGYLPARHPMREIVLTTHPLEKTSR